MFQADGQAQKIRGAAGVGAFDRRAVLDQAVRAAQAGNMAEQFQTGDKFEGFGLTAFYLNGHHAAEAGHLRGGNLVSGV
jgi:hypothetical protein